MLRLVSLILLVLLLSGVSWNLLVGILIGTFVLWIYFAQFLLAFIYVRTLRYAKEIKHESDEQFSENLFDLLKIFFGVISATMIILGLFFFVTWQSAFLMTAMTLVALEQIKEKF